MREFLDNHPVSALIGACVLCIGITSAVLNYFNDQTLLIAKAPLKSRIRELLAQLTSIKRGIPIDGPRSFNVASSVVDENKMLLLSNEFKVLMPNLIAVDTPMLGAWTYAKLNEISAAALSLDDECRDKRLKKIEKSELPPHVKTVFTWHKRTSNSAYIRLPSQSPLAQQCKHLRIFPSLSVYLIDADWIKNNVNFFSFHLPLKKLSKEKIKSLLTDPASIMSDPNVAITYMNEDNQFLSEFTGPFLFHKMYGMLTLGTIFPEAAPRVISIEKAQNTLYFHSRYRILASINKDISSERVSVVVDDEYFVMNIGASAVVVNITLPVLKNHHENFGWTQRWLSGLRVKSH